MKTVNKRYVDHEDLQEFIVAEHCEGTLSIRNGEHGALFKIELDKKFSNQ